MSIFRVNKDKDYVTMKKYHLKEKNMSLKAKGLLSEMLSLPDEWDYSINGLVAINKESEKAIESALLELKEFGYLKVTKLMPNVTTSGRIEYIYDIYEEPIKKQGGTFLGVEIQGVEIQGVEKEGQLNNKQLNTKELNNNNNIYTKHKYGIYGRIKLTDKEYNRLVEDYGKEYIDKQINLLDEYVESNNNKNKYSNFNLVLRKSIREKWFNNTLPSWFNKEIEKEKEYIISDEDRRRFGIKKTD